MNKTRGQSVLKILNGGVKSLNYPTPPGSKFPISWGGWRCELGGFNPPSNLTLSVSRSSFDENNECLSRSWIVFSLGNCRDTYFGGIFRRTRMSSLCYTSRNPHKVDP